MERRKVGYDLGCYGSMSEVWQAWPGGGRPGEYLRVGTVVYHWDAAQGNWRSDVYPHVESYRLARLDGDLSVGNRLMVGGSLRVMQDALFKRDVRIEGTLVYSHLRGMDCGLHPTYENLVAAFPTPKKGNWALVGTSADALSMYTCQSDGVWTMTAQHQNLSDVFSLSAYDNAVSVLDTIVSKGYIFQGVAFPGTVPACPSSHKAFYLASTRGRYDHFGGIEVRGLTAILWEPIASPDDIQVPAVPVLSSNSNEEVAVVQQNVGSEEAVTTGAWHAYLLLAGVFVYGENIANDSIGMNHLTPELRNYLNQLALDITNVRQDMKAGMDDLEKKLRGVGQRANAFVYPTFRLGDFSTMDEVNNAINQVYSDEGCTTHQGHLRLTRNGQMIFVDQYAIDYSVGKWAQVAFGMVAPSADGLQLRQAGDHPHILWRMAGVDDNKWHDISGTMSLKTINGQSLLGEGNIVVGGGGGTPIPIDDELDPTSHHPLSNYGVARALQNVIAECKIFPMYEVIKVSEDDEGDPLPLDAPEGCYAVLSGMLLTFVDGTWETVKKGDGGTPVTSFYYKYNHAVYVCDEGDIAYGFSVGSQALYRCHRHPLTRVVLPDGLYIRGNTLISRSGGVDTEALGDPNAFYVIVEENKMYVVDGEAPSSQLKQLSDNITPIFEVKNIDVIHQHPSDMSLPYGYYVYQNESEDGLQLYYHGVGSWLEREEPKAYLIYNNEVVLYNNNNLSYTGIMFRESQPPFIKIISSSPSTHPQTVSENGYYIYNNSQSVPAIFKYHNGTWTEQTAEVLPKAYVIWADNLWKYENGQLTDPVPYGGGGTAAGTRDIFFTNGSLTTDGVTNGSFNTNENGSEARGVNLAPLFGTLNNKVSVLEGAQGDDTDETLYPEYYLTAAEKETLRYCPNYYDWNTVWYNSDINTPSAQDDIEAVVVHPTEYLSSTLPHVDGLRMLETQLVYPRTGQAELSHNWLSSTGVSGDAIAPQRRVAYKLASASANYPAGSLFFYEGLHTDEVNALPSTVSSSDRNKAATAPYTAMVDYDDSVKRLITEDVYYSTNLAQFVLKVGNVYYKHWNNSYLWNNENADRTVIVASAHLRSDTVYCPIADDMEGGVTIKHSGFKRDENDGFRLTDQVVTSSANAENNTWVLYNGVRTPIRQTFTDFTEAIVQCVEHNDGNLRLHSNKVYGMTDSNYEKIPGSSLLAANHELRSRSGFVMDGQNSTICFISSMKKPVETRGTSQDNTSNSVLSLYKCTDFTIQNIKIKGVRSATQNTSSGKRFSHTACPVYGINMLTCRHAYIHNVEFQGCYYDWQAKLRSSSSDPEQTIITIDGWKSEDSGGAYIGSALPVLEVRNSYVKMNKYMAHHMFYNSDVENALIKDCVLIEDSVYNDNFIQPKNSDKRLHTITYQDGNVIKTKCKEYLTKFSNCYIQTLIGGLSDNGYDVPTIEFRNCTIVQSNNRYHGVIAFWSASTTRGSMPAVDDARDSRASALYTKTAANVIFDGCDIATYGQVLLVSTWHRWLGRGLDYYSTIQITNNKITVLDVDNRQKYIRSGESRLFLSLTFGDLSQAKGGFAKLPGLIIQGNKSNCDIICNLDDTATSAPKAKGSDFRDRPVGFSYFNTALNKMMWLTEKIGIYSVWTTIDGDEYSDAHNMISSSATAPTTSTKGYVYTNSTLGKKLALFTTSDTNVWVDSDWNAYLDNGTSVPTKMYGDSLDEESVGYFFLNLTNRKTYTIDSKVTLTRGTTTKTAVVLRNGTDYYTPSLSALSKLDVFSTKSDDQLTEPALGAAYYNTRVSKVLFYFNKVNGIHIWVDSGNAHQYDKSGNEVQ